MIIENSIVSADTNSTQKVACKIEANSVMFDLLSSRLYSDKPLAVVRELSTNALDAQIENNTQDKPFIVHLPTRFEPFFSIRDFGKGMSNDVVMDLYSTMGSSSKRDSNLFNGALGIGSKSPFAYTQGGAFTLTSTYDGVKTIYSVYSDNGVPSIAVLGSFPADDVSGVEITVPIQVEDINTFKRKAEEVYRHFKVKPKTNIKLENLDYGDALFKGDNWAIFNNSNCSNVVMANVGYPINTDNYNNLSTLSAKGLIIFAETGEVQMSGSRESLSYTKETIEALTVFNQKITKEIFDNIEVEKKKYENNLLLLVNYLSQLPQNIRAILSRNKVAEYIEVKQSYYRIFGEGYFEFVSTPSWGQRYDRSFYLTPNSKTSTQEFILDDNGSQTQQLLSHFKGTRTTLNTIRPLFERGQTKEEKEVSKKKLEDFAKILGITYKFASVKYIEVFGAPTKTLGGGVSTAIKGSYKATGLTYTLNDNYYNSVSNKTYSLSEDLKDTTIYIPFENKCMSGKNWVSPKNHIFNYSEEGAIYAVKSILKAIEYPKTVNIVSIPVSKKSFASRATCVYDFLEEVLSNKSFGTTTRADYDKIRGNVLLSSILTSKYEELPKDYVSLIESAKAIEKSYEANLKDTISAITNFGLNIKSMELTLSVKDTKALDKYSAIIKTVNLRNTNDIDSVVSLVNVVHSCSKTRNKGV